MATSSTGAGPVAGYGPQAPVPQGWYGPPAVAAYPMATDQRDRTAMAVIAWILTVVTLLYFLPWAIAATRGKSDAGVIGLINFLLGWTLIGWIVALVMACQAHRRVGVYVNQQTWGAAPPPPPPAWGQPPTGPGWPPSR